MTQFDNAWRLPPTELVLPHNEVHVWRAELDQPLSLIGQLGQTLSADERTRASRFHFARDRQHFIVCRGCLRNILGRYMGIEPGQVQFRYGPYGKPALVETQLFVEAGLAPALNISDNTLQFNVSHSHTLALYAFTRGREIGVDLEYIRPIAEAEQIAKHYFSVQENDTLHNLPLDAQYEQFFIYWTHKEAYLKARGEGLTGLEGDQTSTKEVPTDWVIQHLTPAPGYVAALAIQERAEGTPRRIVYWQWASYLWG